MRQIKSGHKIRPTLVTSYYSPMELLTNGHADERKLRLA